MRTVATGQLPGLCFRIFSLATGWTRCTWGGLAIAGLLPESDPITHDCKARELPFLFPDYPLTHTFFRPHRFRKVP